MEVSKLSDERRFPDLGGRPDITRGDGRQNGAEEVAREVDQAEEPVVARETPIAPPAVERPTDRAVKYRLPPEEEPPSGVLNALRRRFIGERTLSEQFTAASRRKGFKPYLTTLALFDLCVVFFITLIPNTLLVVLGSLVLLSINLYFIRKLLGQAFNEVRTLPESAIIPEKGLPLLKFRVYDLYGRPDKVPTLSPEQWFAEMKLLYERRILQLFREYRIMPVIWIGNPKGQSSKSMNSAVAVTILGELLGSHVFVLPTMANDSTGTVGKLAGLKKISATMRELSDKWRAGLLKDPVDLTDHVFSNGRNAFVISEGPVKENDRRYFSSARWVEVFEFVKRVARIMILDTGNDGAHKDSVTTTGLRYANVVWFACAVDSPQTVHNLREYLFEYYIVSREFPAGKPAGNRVTAEDISIAEKIQKAVVVINGVDPEGDLREYRHFVEIGEGDIAQFDGDITFIRHDPYLKSLVEGFQLTKLNDLTYLDYLIALTLCFERAAELLGIEIPERHPFIRVNTGLALKPMGTKKV